MFASLPKLPTGGANIPAVYGKQIGTFANGYEPYPVPSGIQTYKNVSDEVALMPQAPPKKVVPAPYIVKSKPSLF